MKPVLLILNMWKGLRYPDYSSFIAEPKFSFDAFLCGPKKGRFMNMSIKYESIGKRIKKFRMEKMVERYEAIWVFHSVGMEGDLAHYRRRRRYGIGRADQCRTAVHGWSLGSRAGMEAGTRAGDRTFSDRSLPQAHGVRRNRQGNVQSKTSRQRRNKLPLIWTPRVRREIQIKRHQGLAFCEQQEVSPLALPWFHGYCSNQGTRSTLAWTALKGQSLSDRAVYSWGYEKAFSSS